MSKHKSIVAPARIMVNQSQLRIGKGIECDIRFQRKMISHLPMINMNEKRTKIPLSPTDSRISSRSGLSSPDSSCPSIPLTSPPSVIDEHDVVDQSHLNGDDDAFERISNVHCVLEYAFYDEDVSLRVIDNGSISGECASYVGQFIITH
jgi:hypothetical protein